jgi:hypothetical protein
MEKTMKVLLSILLLGIPLSVASAPMSCYPGLSEHSEDSAGNKLYCVDSQLVGPDSFCLRTYPNDARHVRQLAGQWSLRTDFPVSGRAKVDRATHPVGGTNDPCASDPADFMQVDDIIHILRKDANTLTLQVFQPDEKTARAPYFAVPVVLKPGPSNGRYFWWGTGTDPSTDPKKKKPDLDFFVMLADDKKGDMKRNADAGVPRIEQYILVEAFLKTPSNDQCEASRPDFPDRSGLANFHPWDSGDSSCDSGTKMSENGSGGGGHTWP